jgi:hypothetical protein
MMTFDDRLARAYEGDEIVYHVGYHCMKSVPGKEPVKNEVAKQAWAAYVRGDVLLYQRRVGPNELQYCAKVLK